MSAADGQRVCLVIQHVEPEGPSVLGVALLEAGISLRYCRVFAGDPLPTDTAGLSGLVVMGGPMSAVTDAGFPTRQAELTLLRHALEEGLPVLGICLGAQLLAVAAGGRVHPGERGPEIGWGDIELTPEAAGDPLLRELPAQLNVLHWHGDTYELPSGTTHLASSAAYPQQAFRAGPAAWGLQFHLEVDAETVQGFADAFEDEAAEAGVCVGDIVRAAQAALAALSPARDRVLQRFSGLVSGTAA